MLDGKEEEEPRSRRDEILYGRPARNTEYLSLYQRREARETEHAVAFVVRPLAGIEYEEDDGDKLRGSRADGCSCNPHGGQAEFPEDEYVVEHHVAEYHYDTVQREDGGACGGHVESTEHAGDEREEEPPDAQVDVVHGGPVDGRRREDVPQQHGRYGVGEEGDGGGYHHQYCASLKEDIAYRAVLSLAVAAAHKDFGTHAEAESQHV